MDEEQWKQWGRILEKLENLDERLEHITERLDMNYITTVEFEPVKKIVYALVAVILISFVGSLIALVFRGSPSEARGFERQTIQGGVRP